MKAFFAYIAKIFIEVIIEKLTAFFEGLKKEKEASKADEKDADEAVAEVRKPLDPSKSVEERQKDAEDSFDRFRDRLN